MKFIYEPDTKIVLQTTCFSWLCVIDETYSQNWTERNICMNIFSQGEELLKKGFGGIYHVVSTWFLLINLLNFF